jgi:SHS2 domain-containing protein
MAYRLLSHTADTGVEATAPDLDSLLEDLAAGMFASMARPKPDSNTQWLDTRVESDTVDDLAVEVLSELLGRAEVDDLLLCDFEISVAGTTASIRARGVPLDQTEPQGPPIKAVTYHRLTVEHRHDGWYGCVYFDV